jgi:hypothetical protein
LQEVRLPDEVNRFAAGVVAIGLFVRLPLAIACIVIAAGAGYLFADWATPRPERWKICAAATWFHDQHYDDPIFAQRYEKDFKMVLAHCPP